MIADRLAPPIDALVTSALDRAPDHVTILDESGDIVWVNRAWIDFGAANGATVDSWIGRNYLDPPCRPERDDDALAQLEVVRSVLDGRADERTSEYPCHSPTEQRWFSFDVWAFEAAAQRYVIVSHHNLTPQYLAERRALQLAQTDPLTGLANRRRLDEFLDRHWFHAMRYGLDVSLLIVDVDHFKQWNDRFGHEVGDLVLRQLAAVMESVCRRSNDLAARIGGDEFVAVITGAASDDAAALAEQVRSTFASNADRYLEVGATVSVGLATMRPTDGQSVEHLVSVADRRLLAAKRSGRNRVVADGLIG